jgi:hypothetical protein
MACGWLKAKATADDLFGVHLYKGAKRLTPRSATVDGDQRGVCHACIKQARCLQQRIHNPGKSLIVFFRIKPMFLNLGR